MIDEVVSFPARDGVTLSARVYRPDGGGKQPALFAASPYRFDNNEIPASPQFLWRETGPIEWYVNQGYAYVHMDIRGCGRSGGSFEFLGKREQTDLYDAIEWIGAQSWCTGKVGGIGQSYFCMVMWFMGAQSPPSLACLAAHDGLADVYRAGTYHGGIACDFFPGYWWYQNRIINRHPSRGPSTEQDTDLTALVGAHPTYDEFWRERSAWEVLDRIKVPLYSSGVWAKHQLHTRGNIDGFLRAIGPKKLRMSGAPNAWGAAAEFNSVAFHEKVLLPFYDHYLKGKETNYAARPPVEYAVRGNNAIRTAQEWPPAHTKYLHWYLTDARSGSVNSLNDGSLSEKPPQGARTTSYTYPDPGWVSGVVGFGPDGPTSGFDPPRRVVTFTSPPLEKDIEIAGPIKLVLYASSTAKDTDFVVKLTDQFPQSPEDRNKGINPYGEVVTRGWLRASHRELDDSRSTEHVPYHTHRNPQPLVTDKIYKFDISLEPSAYCFRARHRIRLEIANGDSPVTEVLWSHYYSPNKRGTDTFSHSSEHPSHLVLPVSTV